MAENFPQQPKAHPSDVQNQASEPSVFFNVMPKDPSESGGFVEAKTKLQAGAIEPQRPTLMQKMLERKLLFIAPLVAVVAGLALYVVITKVFTEGESEDLVLKTRNPNTSQKPDENPDLSNPLTPGFTTPKEWRDKYFPGCTDESSCGDEASLDRDGLTNLQEYTRRTDPNNPDSDQDGLDDGDEVNIFNSDPMESHSAGNPKYSDLDYVRDGYDIPNDKQMTPEQIAAVAEKMKTFGLHETTVASLGDSLKTVYKFSVDPAPMPPPTGTASSTSTSTLPTTLDMSLEAQQDRDARRSNAIKNIEIALVKYYEDNQQYPIAEDFTSMFAMVKPYWKVAINPEDPINVEPYVFTYLVSEDGSDFVLSFFSEQTQAIIKKTADDAQKDAALQAAAIYDNQRQSDLESLRVALLLYSQNNVAGNQDYVFPAEDKYKTLIVPEYISQIPNDPKTGTDYEYKTNETFTTFTVKTALDNPEEGTTGWMCNQVECLPY